MTAFPITSTLTDSFLKVVFEDGGGGFATFKGYWKFCGRALLYCERNKEIFKRKDGKTKLRDSKLKPRSRIFYFLEYFEKLKIHIFGHIWL